MGNFIQIKNMLIENSSNYKFEIRNTNGIILGVLEYKTTDYSSATIKAEKNLIIEQAGTGLWYSYELKGEQRKKLGELKIASNSTMLLFLEKKNNKYKFKKNGGWRIRFSLSNKEDEEIMAFLHNINWQRNIYELKLQLNEDFMHEMSTLLILHTLHCTICSLSMINDGIVPALINV